ncbi:MAG: nucleotidyltransferase domain-containing protein [Spirochaetaceae bacterium]|nr:nucleotidyltransferase domain-containing protein [Spirochaetaceae bacterium]
MRPPTTGGESKGKTDASLHPIAAGSSNRDQVLALLRAHKATLVQRFGVAELALFGSFARDQATDDSDLDILVSFDGMTDWRRYFCAQFYLEDLLGRPVDLVTDKALRAELRPHVEREAVHVSTAEYQSVMEQDAGARLYRHDAKSGMVALKVKTIQRIRSQLSVGEFDFSRHAFKRLVERNISGAEIQQAGSRANVIEEYPDDKYSPSCLLLGFTHDGRALHMQVSLADTDLVKIITLYEPHADEWIEYVHRR